MNAIARYLPLINENQVKAWEQREAEVKAGTRCQPNQKKPKWFSAPTKKTEGIAPPEEFSRHEVVKVLMEYYGEGCREC